MESIRDKLFLIPSFIKKYIQSVILYRNIIRTEAMHMVWQIHCVQTAIFKPSCRSKKVKNLFYTGQLTVPGPGVPPSLISGEVVANEIKAYYH